MNRFVDRGPRRPLALEAVAAGDPDKAPRAEHPGAAGGGDARLLVPAAIGGAPDEVEARRLGVGVGAPADPLRRRDEEVALLPEREPEADVVVGGRREAHRLEARRARRPRREARHAAAVRPGPDAAARRFGDLPDQRTAQPAIGAEVDEGGAVEAREPLPGRDPEEAEVVLEEGVHPLVDEPVADAEAPELRRLRARRTGCDE